MINLDTEASRRVIISGLLIFSTFYCKAQFNETIRTGRPGQSIGPFAVGRNVLQIQSGLDFFGAEHLTPQTSSDGFVSNNVIRFGITRRLEVSSLIDYRSETVMPPSMVQETMGLSAFDLGGRYLLYEGHGTKLSIGLQVRFRLPVLSDDYQIDHVAPRFTLATSQQLTKTLTLFTNWGGSWDGISNRMSGFYTVNISFPIAGKFGGFIESYGGLTDNDFDNRFDTGVAFMMNNNLQLDVFGGPGFNDGVRDFFVSIGFSWRARLKEPK